VALDKSEGAVKHRLFPSVFLAPFYLPEGLRTKTLEISRWITHRWKIVPPTIDSA